MIYNVWHWHCALCLEGSDHDPWSEGYKSAQEARTAYQQHVISLGHTIAVEVENES